jgi:ABC-type dipeptide/oligopeptide/nickel transport system permease subunit
MSRKVPAMIAVSGLLLLLVPGLFAPEFLSPPDMAYAFAGPLELPPFGADQRGRPLLQYATQGARVVALPSLIGGLLVMLLSTMGGLIACAGGRHLQTIVQIISEILGALPRLVVILVVALILPRDGRGLLPIAVTWALLSAPGAIDEASAVAARLGGARFVEALRAHGFSRFRIYLVHLVAYNLRPVVVRQGVETFMQITFLEIGLSYLAVASNQSSFTHADSVHSWANLLALGYKVVLGVHSGHALVLGLGLVALVAGTAVAVTHAVRAR